MSWKLLGLDIAFNSLLVSYRRSRKQILGNSRSFSDVDLRTRQRQGRGQEQRLTETQFKSDLQLRHLVECSTFPWLPLRHGSSLIRSRHSTVERPSFWSPSAWSHSMSKAYLHLSLSTVSSSEMRRLPFWAYKKPSWKIKRCFCCVFIVWHCLLYAISELLNNYTSHHQPVATQKASICRSCKRFGPGFYCVRGWAVRRIHPLEASARKCFVKV